VDANPVNDALTSYVPQLWFELILGTAACVLFLGGTFRPNRCLWGWVALIALGLGGLGLWGTAATVKTAEVVEAENATKQANGRKEILELQGQSQALEERIRTAQRADKAALTTEKNAIDDSIHQKTRELEALPKTRLAEKFAAPIQLSRVVLFAKLFALIVGAVLLGLAWDEVPESHAAEYFACLLLIVAGTGLTAAANDLITLFLAGELVSIPTYVMLYLPRADAPAQEAAMKYFLLSIFSSALFLFGFSYLYGLGGTTNLPALAEALRPDKVNPAPRGLLLVALVMVLAGAGFRLTAVPFHFYAPDVYQGTATANAAFLAVVPKIGGFLALFRVFALIPGSGDGRGFDVQLPVVLWIMAAVTMSLGNVLALLQDNIKRLLAYSSVSHSGYMLIGLTAAARVAAVKQDVSVGGVEGILFYLVAYGAMTIGAFALLSYLSTPEKPVENIDDLSGLARSRPGVALTMTLFLLSLVGIPLTAGFFGKVFLFYGAMETPIDLFPDKDATGLEQASLFNLLLVIAVVNAAMGGWYYMRLIVAMYLRESPKPTAAGKPRPVLVAVGACVVATLLFGVYPKPLLDAARKAARIEQTKAPPPSDQAELGR
jgi:NADH-quinone oxidoreductase subunit N